MRSVGIFLKEKIFPGTFHDDITFKIKNYDNNDLLVIQSFMEELSRHPI